MEKKHLNEANRYTSRNNRRRLWQRIVGALGCMVVFVTTYVLILPAITMEADCGNTEHTHAESCYSQVLSRQVTQLQCTAQVHTHTADCTDAEGTTVCGYADYLAHTHSGLCYDAAGGLLCAIQENEVHEHTDACYEAVKLHEHTDACYTEEKGELTCTVAEGEGAHAHSGACYEAVTQTICGQEEAEGHTHGDACLDESGALACGLEETAGHTHDASCVNTTSTLVCQQEETPGHRHEDACYAWTQVESCGMTGGEPETAEPTLVCGKKEVKLHTHTDACIDAEGKVVCGAVEVLEHSHSEDCLVTTEAAVDTTNLTCGLEEGESHTHAERCYGTWELSCGLAEHTHTDECYSDVEETTAPTTEPTEAEEETLSEEDYGISLWALLPEEEVDGGTVPNSEITWRITVNDAGEYTLYLDGEGAIPDNPDSSEIYSPWYGYRSTEMKIVFGEGITSTGQRTFQNMIVSGIDFGGVETIGKAAFSGIRTNYDITIPGTVKTIEGSAFSVSVGSYRKSIYLSEGTETIGQSAFGSHEWAIPTPQVFYIPSTVSSIGLYFNYAVSEFDVAEDNPYYCDVDGVLYTKDMTTLVCFPAYMQIDEFTIPASVTKVSTGAFQNAHVKKLIIPDTVTSLPAIGGLSNAIEEIVFDDDFIFSNGRAVSLTSYPMKRLHLPENTTYSIRSLFSMYYSHGTSMIESIKIPKGVTSIREFTEDQPEWVRMPNLKEVIYDAQNATLDVSVVDGVTDAAIISWLESTVGTDADEVTYTADATANPTTGNTVEFDVPYGYYYITSTLGAAVTVNKNTPSVSLIDKNTTNPGPGGTDTEYKYIVDSTGDKGTISASIGDTINYKVVFEATNFVTTGEGDAAVSKQIKNYVIEDTPSGVKLNESSIVVKVGTKTLTKGTDYTVADAGKTITITWANSTTDDDDNVTWSSIYTSPVSVEITYSAEVTAAGSATNNVKINYNNTDGTSGNVVTPDPDDPQTEIKSYELTVKKVDDANTTLTGATFELYDAATGGNLIPLVKVTETDSATNTSSTYYRVATTEERSATGFTSAVVEAGEAVIKGLGNGTYYLEETAAPAGYNKLTARETVEIEDANKSVSIENKAGALLPSTGGMGTTVFYVLGGILVLAAIVLLVTKRRMSTAE